MNELSNSGSTDQKDVYEEIPPSDELLITANKIALVYIEIKVGMSIRGHEVLAEGLVHLGFLTGYNLNGKRAAHDIISFLGAKIHSNLI